MDISKLERKYKDYSDERLMSMIDHGFNRGLVACLLVSVFATLAGYAEESTNTYGWLPFIFCMVAAVASLVAMIFILYKYVSASKLLAWRLKPWKDKH